MTLSMIYPQLWAKNPTHVDEEFHWQLTMLKATFCALCTMGESKKVVLALLSIHALDL
jgi:hypothetical protein